MTAHTGELSIHDLTRRSTVYGAEEGLIVDLSIHDLTRRSTNPTLRWAVNNTKMIRYGRKLGKEDDADIGNFVYAKIEAKSRKTDPFMALVASMTVEDALPYAQVTNAPDLGVFTY